MNAESKKIAKEFLKYAMLPIVLLATLFLLFLLREFFGIPSFSEIVDYAESLFETHGYWVIFVAAIAEGILFFNWYLPGSAVVVMGAVIAMETDQNIFLVLLVITLGFFITAIINKFRLLLFFFFILKKKILYLFF